jgi:16S rRNA (guanine527-N7)-methyltransferase
VLSEILAAKLKGIIELSAPQVAALERHFELLLKWNRVLNLTSVRDPGEMVERHYCESLFLAARLPAGTLSIADIGSGPGFPGFPVAVARPDCSVVLIESHQRKSVFLREAARFVSNVRVMAVRAEAVGEEFDHVISRAVSYADLGKSLKRMGRNADLLSGAEEPPASLGFDWGAPLALPWGDQRFLRIGKRRE